MPSQILPSERHAYPDPLTGREMIRWTSSPSLDRHLYFTSQSVTSDDRWLVFLSERDGGNPNFFAITRSDGRIHRLTDNRSGSLASYVYPSDNRDGIGKSSPILDESRNTFYYILGREVRRFDLDDFRETTLFALPERWWTAFSHISPDGRTLCVPCTHPDAFPPGQTTQWEQLKTAPDLIEEKGLVTRLYLIDTATGAARIHAEVPFWGTHVNFAPDNSGRLLVNSEGYASATGQSSKPRIWRIDVDGTFSPLFDQRPGIYVNHENWARNDNWIIYHGSVPDEGYSFIAARDWDGNPIYEYRLVKPSLLHATPMLDPRAALIDRGDPRTIAMVEPGPDGQPRIIDLCLHDSLDGFGGNQDFHPHPLQTPDGRGVIFSSNKAGNADVYELRL